MESSGPEVKTEFIENSINNPPAQKRVKVAKNVILSSSMIQLTDKLPPPPKLNRVANTLDKGSSQNGPPPMLRGPYPLTKNSLVEKLNCKPLNISGKIINGVSLKSIKVKLNKRPTNS